jgi:hypothetical protein
MGCFGSFIGETNIPRVPSIRDSYPTLCWSHGGKREVLDIELSTFHEFHDMG